MNGQRNRFGARVLGVALVTAAATAPMACTRSHIPDGTTSPAAAPGTEVAVDKTAALISDQANSAGRTGFIWIAPMVPTTPSGFTTIDQTGIANGLTIKVDQLLANGTTAPKTSFTGSAITLVTGSSSPTFPGVTGPFYGANWAPGSTVASGETYRVSVQAPSSPTRLLGIADVQVVADATGASGIDRTNFTPLIVGNTLAIVFRLENKDTDGDQLNDWRDNCPITQNANQLDSDGDGIGNACQCLNMPNGTACSTGCKTGETCTLGVCGGGTNKTAGTACNDGNACTTGETCQAGSCTNGATVTCTANQCQTVGACVPASGCPAPVAKVNGTACSDGNACTQNDTCQGGVCNSGATLACPGDACRPAGTCDATTGLCSFAVAFPDNTACDDGNRCSINDTCKAGTCMPGPTTNGCQGPTDIHYVPVVNLGSTQQASCAAGINNFGEVVAVDERTLEARGSGPIPTSGFRWTATAGMQPLPQSPHAWSFPTAINVNGAVAGTLWDFQAGGTRTFRQNAATDTQLQIPVQAGWATGLNDNGVMTGVTADATGYKMFRAGASGVELLPIVAGDMNTQPQSIDSAGNLFGFTIRNGWALAAFRYTDLNHIQFLNQLVPTVSDWAADPVVGGNYLSVANFTNGAQIIGSGHTSDGLLRGFVMTPGANGQSGSIKKIDMVSTVTSPASYATSPRGINHNGEVVGSITDLSGIHDLIAFVWVDGTGIVDLNQLIDPASGWVLSPLTASTTADKSSEPDGSTASRASMGKSGHS